MATLAANGVTAVSLDRLPRTLSRAQSMDALTSQANVAGYRAVLVAASAYQGYFPMLMTAAGTVRPAVVLVLGAGVAGLQAIGTARRLGAVVNGYDVRPEARGDIESLGGKFLDLGTTQATSEGGYARALTDDETRAQQQALAAAIARNDVVITTAQVPGARPPVLVTAEAVAAMRSGSVIVDLAAGPLGGNVDGSLPDATVVTANGVSIIGAGNLPSSMAAAASTAYSRNVSALLDHLRPDGALTIDPTDEIQAGVVVTHGGAVVNPAVASLLAKG
jgi:NAD(P) transhydrogenase subunit alpha